MSWIHAGGSLRRSSLTLSSLFVICFLAFTSSATAQAINENFSNLNSMINTGGWASINKSEPVNFGVTRWSQCTGALIPPAQAGGATSCVFADWNSVAPDQAGTISNWLMGPTRRFNNRDKISFYTKTVAGNPFGDRLQVRLSTSGSSTDVGTLHTDVGDFTTLLLDINPDYEVGEYPEVWTQYTVTISGLQAPVFGRFAFRYFIEGGGQNGNVGYIVGVDSVVYKPTARKNFDYDNDGRDDIAVFRPSAGSWYVQQSTDGFYDVQFGAAGDRIVPADFDGDSKTDIAVYRPSLGVWYILNSADGTISIVPFGIAEDQPVPGDYDGDWKADHAVFRPSEGVWYRMNSSNGSFSILQFGITGDKPTVGDFDGDGKSDIGIFRPADGAWYHIRSSNNSVFAEQFGISVDKIVPADYDGDGKTDIAIYRPAVGLWYVRNSATATYTPYIFGLADDIPVPGDFDGDDKADIAVFRPSNGVWYIDNSSGGGPTIVQFGADGDVPVESSFGGN